MRPPPSTTPSTVFFYQRRTIRRRVGSGASETEPQLVLLEQARKLSARGRCNDQEAAARRDTANASQSIVYFDGGLLDPTCRRRLIPALVSSIDLSISCTRFVAL